jgi:hypothetical protein
MNLNNQKGVKMKKLLLLLTSLACPSLYSACSACSFAKISRPVARPAVSSSPAQLNQKINETHAALAKFQILKTQVLNLNVKNLPKKHRLLFQEIKNFLQKLNAANLSIILKQK